MFEKTAFIHSTQLILNLHSHIIPTILLGSLYMPHQLWMRAQSNLHISLKYLAQSNGSLFFPYVL